MAGEVLGYPASGSIDIVQPFSSNQTYLGLFLQDNFRVSRRLTVRWDVKPARNERLTASFRSQCRQPAG